MALAILQVLLDWVIKRRLSGKPKPLHVFIILGLLFIATGAIFIQLNYPSWVAVAHKVQVGAKVTQMGEGFPNNGKIAFVSWRTGNPHVYIMDPNGSNPIRLSGLTYPEYTPRWSPDNHSIVISAQTGTIPCGSILCAVWDILKVNISSSQFVNLTNGYTNDNQAPTFSPDGQRIAFVAGLNNSSGHLIIMNQDGTNISPTSITSANFPDWSPDGSKILYTSPWGSPSGIFTNDLNTGEIIKIKSGVMGAIASWSPDGQKIAFSMKVDGNEEIYLINADRTGLTRLTNNSYNDSSPTWSQDGNWLTFTSDRNGNSEIYIMKIDGTSQERLTTGTRENLWPDWSK